MCSEKRATKGGLQSILGTNSICARPVFPTFISVVLSIPTGPLKLVFPLLFAGALYTNLGRSAPPTPSKSGFYF